MARIVVTYAESDFEVVDRLQAWLTANQRHVVVPLRGLRLSGEGLKDRAIREISDANYVVAILSKSSWTTPGFAFELGLVTAFEVTLQRTLLFGIVIDDAPVPSVLGSRPIVRVDSSFPEESFPAIEAVLHAPILERPPGPTVGLAQAQALIATGVPTQPAWAKVLGELGKALADRRLVMFLGAGVSVSVGVPTWKALVDRVMEAAFAGMTAGTGLTVQRVAMLMRLHNSTSELILAQHARRQLENKFYDVVRAELYKGASGSSPLLAALGEVVVRGRARAVLTYNFDEFFERELRRRKVPHQVVTLEGERSSKGFPVFHVHGIMRRSGYVRRAGLVFSESEFHNESLDTYRWSSLVQLSHLSHSTCLFVGVSIQDPNLRRLLEVVKKRSPEDVSPHFVIYRHTDPADLTDYCLDPPVMPFEAARAAAMIDTLVEADLNELGLNVIWVQAHDEVADVVAELATSPLVPSAA